MNADRSSRRLPAPALLILLAVVLLGPLARPAQAASPLPSADTGFLSLINNLRSTLGLTPFTPDPELAAIARAWSAHMADTDTLAHNGALTSQVTQGWAKLGENVGVGGATAQIFNALVASPGHLRNMSEPAFSRIGVGSVSDGVGRIWTTHVFLQPRPPRAAPAPAAPAPAKTTAPPAKPAPRASTPTSAAAKAPASTARPTATTAAPTTTAPPPTAAPVTTVAPATTAAGAPTDGAAQLAAADPRTSLAAELVTASTRRRPATGALAVGAGLLALPLVAAGGLVRGRRSRTDGRRGAR